MVVGQMAAQGAGVGGEERLKASPSRKCARPWGCGAGGGALPTARLARRAGMQVWGCRVIGPTACYSHSHCGTVTLCSKQAAESGNAWSWQSVAPLLPIQPAGPRPPHIPYALNPQPPPGPLPPPRLHHPYCYLSPPPPLPAQDPPAAAGPPAPPAPPPARPPSTASPPPAPAPTHAAAEAAAAAASSRSRAALAADTQHVAATTTRPPPQVLGPGGATTPAAQPMSEPTRGSSWKHSEIVSGVRYLPPPGFRVCRVQGCSAERGPT